MANNERKVTNKCVQTPNNWEAVLPSDQCLQERKAQWDQLFERFNEGDENDEGISLGDISNDSLNVQEDLDESNNGTVEINVNEEAIEVSDESTDDGFDPELVFKMLQPIIQKRNENTTVDVWHVEEPTLLETSRKTVRESFLRTSSPGEAVDRRTRSYEKLVEISTVKTYRKWVYRSSSSSSVSMKNDWDVNAAVSAPNRAQNKDLLPKHGEPAKKRLKMGSGESKKRRKMVAPVGDKAAQIVSRNKNRPLNQATAAAAVPAVGKNKKNFGSSVKPELAKVTPTVVKAQSLKSKMTPVGAQPIAMKGKWDIPLPSTASSMSSSQDNSTAGHYSDLELPDQEVIQQSRNLPPLEDGAVLEFPCDGNQPSLLTFENGMDSLGSIQISRELPPLENGAVLDFPCDGNQPSLPTFKNGMDSLGPIQISRKLPPLEDGAVLEFPCDGNRPLRLTSKMIEESAAKQQRFVDLSKEKIDIDLESRGDIHVLYATVKPFKKGMDSLRYAQKNRGLIIAERID